MEEYLNSSQFWLTLYVLLAYFAIWLIAWITKIMGQGSSTRLEATVLNGYFIGTCFHMLALLLAFVMFLLELELLLAIIYAIPLFVMLIADIFFFLYLRKELKLIELRG
jgi:hypothetical protein